jgi:hypothetical protein
MLFGILLWCFLLWQRSPAQETLLTIEYPYKHDLAIYFSGDINAANDDPLTTIEARYSFKGKLYGTIKSHHPSGAHYSFLFEDLIIQDSTNGALVLAFSKHEDGALSYSTDPRYTAKERKGIFDAFAIDTTTSLADEDVSLFQEPISAFLTTDGRISEVLFTPLIRNTLFRSMEKNISGALLTEFLSFSERLPPLFAKTSREASRWVTHGNFFVPIACSHSLQRQDDNILRVKSHAETNLSSRSCSFLSSQDATGKILFDIDWKYDTKSFFVPTAKISFMCTAEAPFLRHTRSTTYSMEVSLKTEPQAREFFITQ